ncbi:hypothetical protein ACLGL1_09100 [Peptococcus simiae]|uniref:hypothetical protein n=1 Tax=Peptococcus simiae TaxID=1643805 RepID=UPI0039807A2A
MNYLNLWRAPAVFTAILLPAFLLNVYYDRMIYWIQSDALPTVQFLLWLLPALLLSLPAVLLMGYFTGKSQIDKGFCWTFTIFSTIYMAALQSTFIRPNNPITIFFPEPFHFGPAVACSLIFCTLFSWVFLVSSSKHKQQRKNTP